MKREAPKEVWLFRFPSGHWALSFDPPTKRNAHRWHRMVPSSDAALRAELRRKDKLIRAAIEKVGLISWAPGAADETQEMLTTALAKPRRAKGKR